ncbi:MAG: molybdenum ABC transporter ATP-binding protein, partial [Rhodospirillaceae bacterium]|nr:molybdenum ABC transporter ATP-binding protein [Rhodospirillaceae bacterium]
LSVHKNLLYGARRAERSGAPPTIRSDDVIQLLGIGHLLDRAPAALSGGERQRVAVGGALLSQPRLLLMAEPLSSLDQMAKDEILPYFEALHEQLSIPILYVSHDITEVARLADRMIILSSGRKLAEGPVRDLLERLDLQPETGRFEAGVILTARVTGHDEKFSVTHLDHYGQAISMPARDLATGTEVRLRIRARDVSLATRRPESISVRNVLSGTIMEIAEDPETAYAETLIDIGGGRLRARITRQSVADLRLAPGLPVYALVKSIAFDRETLSVAATTLPGNLSVTRRD